MFLLWGHQVFEFSPVWTGDVVISLVVSSRNLGWVIQVFLLCG